MHPNNNSYIESLNSNECSELKLSHGEITLSFNSLYLYIEDVSEFKHIKMALLQHLKESIQYLNKSLILLKQEYSEISLLNFDIKTLNQNIKEQKIRDIDEMENQIRELISFIDKRVFLIKSFTYSDTKAHARLLASAMMELMEIQHLYIYPYHENLIPEFLRHVDFKEKIKSNK